MMQKWFRKKISNLNALVVEFKMIKNQILDIKYPSENIFKNNECLIPISNQRQNFYLLQGDTMKILSEFDHKFDMVFADPPYFLSNNGLSIQSGEIVFCK